MGWSCLKYDISPSAMAFEVIRSGVLRRLQRWTRWYHMEFLLLFGIARSTMNTYSPAYMYEYRKTGVPRTRGRSDGNVLRLVSINNEIRGTCS